MPTALVTGATAGLGRAFAHELSRRGYDLVIVARDGVRLAGVAGELRDRDRTTVTVVTADLTTSDGLEAASAAIREHHVDLLVNNAGSSIGRFFGDTDIEDESAQLDLLVRAPLHLTDAALDVMRERGSGQIVNVASVAGFTPRGTYSAHKAWLINLSQWLNIQYAPQGVTTMALCPGFVRTEFHQRMGVDTGAIPAWLWLQADMVVATALDDLERGKAISIPSARYKVLATLARYTPPRLVARLAKVGRKVQE